MINLLSSTDGEPAQDSGVSCSSCRALCCRLEVLLISDTGVPREHIETDQWGGEVMKRLSDGWCSALERDSMLCTIYSNRPWICREFAMGSAECLEERAPLTSI